MTGCVEVVSYFYLFFTYFPIQVSVEPLWGDEFLEDARLWPIKTPAYAQPLKETRIPDTWKLIVGFIFLFKYQCFVFSIPEWWTLTEK